jgi:hypothetical protein
LPAPSLAPALKARLSKLPRVADVWQADFRQLKNPVVEDGKKVQPWLFMAGSPNTGLIIGQGLFTEQTSASLWWEALVQAMQKPMMGKPRRPAEVQIQDAEAANLLRPLLKEIGVKLGVCERVDFVDAAFSELSESMDADMEGPTEPGLVDVVGPDRGGAFFAAAADFFRQAPWKRVGYESAIQVECSEFEGGPWYGVVMGQSGLMNGLAMYHDLKNLQKSWREPQNQEKNVRAMKAFTVTFGPAEECSDADVAAAKRHGWKVARSDAYPVVFGKERGMTTRPPVPWEVELLNLCLQAIPAFVAKRGQHDAGKEELSVESIAGLVKLTLSWVVED